MFYPAGASTILTRINSKLLFRTASTLIPQTGLALMGFSRYCPSSLDLTNFVVRRCRGGVAEVPRRCRGRCAGRPKSGPGLAQASVWESGNLGTRKSRNLGSKKSKKKKFSKSKSILPKMSARSGLVGKILLAPFGAIWGHFLRGPEKSKTLHVFRLCLLFYRFGALAAIHPRWSNRYLCTSGSSDTLMPSPCKGPFEWWSNIPTWLHGWVSTPPC